MKQFFTLLVLITATLLLANVAEAIPEDEVGIIGGIEVTDTKKTPYQISLRLLLDEDDDDLLCGASLIRKDIAITAAQCFISGTDPKHYAIRAGSADVFNGSLAYVKKIVIHPKFVRINHDYDIAIVWLSEPYVLNETLGIVEMVDANEEIKEGELATIGGWGAVEEIPSTVYPVDLMLVDVPIVSEANCKKAYEGRNLITARMICAGAPNKGPCKDDQGGPLVHKNKLAGIISWSHGCGRANFPGVYTKISNLRTWIDDTIKKSDETNEEELEYF